jgi:hypothetical protein
LGKHSVPGSPGFWRTVFLAGFRRIGIVLLLLVVGLAVWKYVINRGNTPQQSGQDSPVITVPSSTPSPSPSPLPLPSPSPAVTGGKIQVLDGSGSPALATKAKDKVVAAGYDVVAATRISKLYEKTTVFYQPGSQSAGEAAASLLGATVTQPAPENLDKTIPVTVVVGKDYPG